MKNNAWKNSVGGLVLVAFSVLVSAMLVAPMEGQQSARGFSMSAAPLSAATTPGGAPAKYTVGIFSSGGFAGTVALSCATGSPQVRCTVVPASVAVNRELAAEATVIATAGRNARGSYSLNVTGASGAIRNSVRLQLIVNAN